MVSEDLPSERNVPVVVNERQESLIKDCDPKFTAIALTVYHFSRVSTDIVEPKHIR